MMMGGGGVFGFNQKKKITLKNLKLEIKFFFKK